MKISLKSNQTGAIGVIEILLVVVLIGAVSFTVWRVNGADEETSKASQSALEASEAQLKLKTLPENLEGLKTFEEIRDSADIGDASIVGVELEQDDGSLVFELKLSDGRVLVFDARTGELVATETDDDSSEDDAIPAGFTTEVTLADALATAKAERPGEKVEKVELEVEDGRVVWSVRFVDDGRVDVDALTGEITRVRDGDNEVDDDNDWDDDGIENEEDDDDDNDGLDDDEDRDDDDDGLDDDDDDDDDNDGVDDEDEEEEEESEIES
ncbi:MAG: PepSY domain-containing protein [Candidatus Saccharimonadales bacterium]|nr:PepSY domain-containing protein [Candidatus Saccharimonadales bacterium]